MLLKKDEIQELFVNIATSLFTNNHYYIMKII